MNITFRANGSGTGKVSFASGSVLANDGRGTNILSSMGSGSYTIQSQTTTPEAEVIVEYVPPVNTPAAPTVRSSTHPDAAGWYKATTAELAWTVPSGVTGVRTLLDNSRTAVPTKVYDTPINSITLADLDDGVSYFHVQFRNADGWGQVTHYRLAVDTNAPTDLKISQTEQDLANPEQRLTISVEDETSEVNRFLVKIDTDEAIEYTELGASSTLTLPRLDPGHHTVIIEAFDQAGNSTVGSYSFTIESFESPVFTDYPVELSEGVIPVIKGTTRSNAAVTVTLEKLGAEPSEYAVTANESGEFIFIPDASFSLGVYELSAVAIDEYGAQSARSETLRIAVKQPGYIRIGSLAVSVLSVLIPLLLLLFAFVVMLVFGWRYVKTFRRSVRRESIEALTIMHREFASLEQTVATHAETMREARKTKKLTKAESDMVEEVLASLVTSQAKIMKEISDVKNLTDNT